MSIKLKRLAPGVYVYRTTDEKYLVRKLYDGGTFDGLCPVKWCIYDDDPDGFPIVDGAGFPTKWEAVAALERYLAK